MEMHITAKNLELSPEARSYITKKLSKINRFLPNILSFDVVASEEKTRSPDDRFILQVTLDSNGTLIRGEERGRDVYTAADKTTEVMNRQIEHYKGKLPYTKKSAGPSIRTSNGEIEEPVIIEGNEDAPRVVKVNKYDVKPMSLEEAVDQMVLLGHDFFLYYNPDSRRINLLYKRKDGDYGLIEPNIK